MKLEVIQIKIDHHNEDRVLNVWNRVELVNDLLRLCDDGLITWTTFLLYVGFYDHGITEVRTKDFLLWYKQP